MITCKFTALGSYVETANILPQLINVLFRPVYKILHTMVVRVHFLDKQTKVKIWHTSLNAQHMSLPVRFGLVCTSVCVCFCLCLCVCLAQQVLLPYERTLYKRVFWLSGCPAADPSKTHGSLGPRGLDCENWVGGRGESKRWRRMGSRGRQTRMPAVTQPFVRFCFLLWILRLQR